MRDDLDGDEDAYVEVKDSLGLITRAPRHEVRHEFWQPGRHTGVGVVPHLNYTTTTNTSANYYSASDTAKFIDA